MAVSCFGIQLLGYLLLVSKNVKMIFFCSFFLSKTLKAFRKGQIQVLVSSDAMTRGMDVEGVKNVINYDMPTYIKTYVHRAGRTARAGQTGCCYSLLREKEVCIVLLTSTPTHVVGEGLVA